MENTFGRIWSFSCLTYWCLMDSWVWRQFIDDIGFILLLTSDMHTRAYSPFIRLRWDPSGALSLNLGIFIDPRSLVEYVDINSSEALLSSLTVFRILGSICGVFLRSTSGSFFSWRQFSVQCIDLVHWGIFPHLEVTRFPSDLVRDSSETCFYSRDYYIPHHFDYSFEIRFRESSLGYWLILHSDFLADYCWVGDSWLMMLASSFLCVRYPH